MATFLWSVCEADGWIDTIEEKRRGVMSDGKELSSNI